VGDCRCGARHDPAPADPQPGSNGQQARRIVAEYDYTDEDGNLLFQAVRFDPKGFSQRQPDGAGDWEWNLKGVRRVLCRLPELIGADPSKPVFIVEGEKDVDRLMQLGLIATTNPMGAGKWLPEYSGYLAQRHVVVLPDNDDEGRDHANKVGYSVHGLAKSVRLLELAGLPEKGDISDWLDAGGTAEGLLDLARKTPEWTPAEAQDAPSGLRFRSAAEIAQETPETPEWVSKPWVPLESIVEVGGKIKVAGKTTFLMGLSRKVLDGLPFMGEPTLQTPVVYLTEQPRSSLREALRRADLLEREDFRVLRYQDTIGTPWKDVVEVAAKECKRVSAKLLVVDTLPQFAALRGDAENSSGAALEALEPIQAVAALGIGVIVARHDGKAAREVGDSGRGSSAWGGVVDIIISIRRGEGNTSPTIRVLHSLSRFDETPDKLVIDLQDGEYIAVGTEARVAVQQAKESILKAAPNSEEEAQKQADLLKDAEVKHTTGVEAINELIAEGQISRTGQGKKGDAFRYWSPKFIESHIGKGVATESIFDTSPSEDTGKEGQPATHGEPAEIHSVATTTLYTTESISGAEEGEL